MDERLQQLEQQVASLQLQVRDLYGLVTTIIIVALAIWMSSSSEKD